MKNCTLKHIFFKFWLINKTTSKVILVWIFDLRIFSDYGHGARTIKHVHVSENRPCQAHFYTEAGLSKNSVNPDYKLLTSLLQIAWVA